MSRDRSVAHRVRCEDRSHDGRDGREHGVPGHGPGGHAVREPQRHPAGCFQFPDRADDVWELLERQLRVPLEHLGRGPCVRGTPDGEDRLCQEEDCAVHLGGSGTRLLCVMFVLVDLVLVRLVVSCYSFVEYARQSMGRWTDL